MKSTQLGLLILVLGAGLYYDSKKKKKFTGLGLGSVEFTNGKTVTIYDKPRAKYNAFVDGEQYTGNDEELLNKLFMGTYETLSLTEQNIKNIYLLIFYAMVGIYSSGKMNIDQVLEFLKLTINEYKSKGWNIIKVPTKIDIENALEEMKAYRKIKWAEK